MGFDLFIFKNKQQKTRDWFMPAFAIMKAFLHSLFHWTFARLLWDKSLLTDSKFSDYNWKIVHKDIYLGRINIWVNSYFCLTNWK